MSEGRRTAGGFHDASSLESLLFGLCMVACSSNEATNPSPPPTPPLVVESQQCASQTVDELVFHPVCLDAEQKIVSWTDAQAPYADVAARAWGALKSVSVLPNGKPTYYSSALFAGVEPDIWAPGKGLPHHPAGVLSMFIDSALPWYGYSGDETVLTGVVIPFADHMLEHGMTEATDAWSNVPYSCSDFGSLTYHGSSIGNQAGDGDGYLEPDKVGEIGYGFARLYEQTGDDRYLNTAVACADALAAQATAGSEQSSPWPFRVDAATGKDVLDPYCAQVTGALRLFRELERIGAGKVATYRDVHDRVLTWALRYPFVNHDFHNYFEDVAATSLQNRNQYAPLELARYLLENPEVTEDAERKAMDLVRWVTDVFTQDFTNDDGMGGTLFEPGLQYGAETVSEQELDTAKMGSHTARFASVLALYYEKTGDAAARERAFRSFNWASYCESSEGIVNVGPNPREGFWFSDGYGDYIRHFMAGLGSIPEWAPATENHLVRSNSVIKNVELKKGGLAYSTFDAPAEDVLRLAASPARVLVGGKRLERGDGPDAYREWDVATGGVVVKLRRSSATSVVVEME